MNTTIDNLKDKQTLHAGGLDVGFRRAARELTGRVERLLKRPTTPRASAYS